MNEIWKVKFKKINEKERFTQGDPWFYCTWLIMCQLREHYASFFSGLEKSVKDLHRQTVALERFRMILNEEVDKTYKRIKSVFEEVRTRYV